MRILPRAGWGCAGRRQKAPVSSLSTHQTGHVVPSLVSPASETTGVLIVKRQRRKARGRKMFPVRDLQETSEYQFPNYPKIIPLHPLLLLSGKTVKNNVKKTSPEPLCMKANKNPQLVLLPHSCLPLHSGFNLYDPNLKAAPVGTMSGCPSTSFPSLLRYPGSISRAAPAVKVLGSLEGNSCSR